MELAGELARASGRDLVVVSIVEPVVLYGPPVEFEESALSVDEEVVAERERSLREQFSPLTEAGVNWSAYVRVGQPAREVGDIAREMDASLILVDASPHRRAKHVISGQRAAQLLGFASVPVVSVAPWLHARPRKAIAAIDFNPASIRAAQSALRLLGDGGALVLLHVMQPMDFVLPLPDVPRSTIVDKVQESLGRLASVLQEGAPGKRIETRVVEGDVVEVLLSESDTMGAELIATGTHGRGVLQRLFLGSVATELLHSASCSVLVSPPPGPIDELQLELQVTGNVATSDRSAWSSLLGGFSDRNMGSPTVLEVDDPAVGAQIQAHGYLLRGVTFEEAEDRVVVMLGSNEGDKPHLTRSIPGVSAIAVTQDSDGRDRALQLSHDGGQTLLMIQAEK